LTALVSVDPDTRPRGTPAATLRAAVAAVAALTLLEALWELWLALKALPLALLWPGLARGATRPRQWLSLLLPLYFAEATVRALTEGGRHRIVAIAAVVLAGVAFGAILATFRGARESRRRSPTQQRR